MDGLRAFGDERYAETARDLMGYLFAEAPVTTADELERLLTR